MYEWGYACWNDRTHCSFDGAHLVLKTSRDKDVQHDLELDVTFQDGQAAWRGTFTQDGSGAEIRLQRPRRRPGVPVDVLERNWRDFASASLLCMHARQKSDGELLIWLDRGGDPRNPYAGGSYGADVFRWERTTEGGRVNFQMGGSFGIPHAFTGVLSDDDSRFEGYWDGSDRRERPSLTPAVPSVFVRMEGESCSVR